MSSTEPRPNRIHTRWKISQKAIATLLLTAMPVQAMAAGAGSPAPPAQPRPVLSAATAAVTTREIVLFGPQKYVRTTGPADQYTATLQVPAWLAAPFRLHVDNGEADGTFRVSSATVAIDGTPVLTQSDFNRNAASYDRAVTLQAGSQLVVTLTSKPTSYLTLSVFGTSTDYTAPKLALAQPAPSSTINTATPRLLVQYSDPVGPSEPAASGVDVTTLKVTVDGVDRTSLFTRRSSEASAQWPATLGLTAGRHTYTASVADLAGNRTDISGAFMVDLTPPIVALAEPATGSYLATRTPAIRITYQDETALDLGTLHLTLGATDLTPLLAKGAGEATVTWPAGTTAPEGPNQLTATIRDLGGNEATATATFNLDVRAPQLSIVQPLAGARMGSREVAVKLVYSDDQALVPSSATLSVDGNSVAVTAAGDGATAQLSGLADGSHALAARVLDRAGNATTATASFTVDTTVPKIEVVRPAAGAKLMTATPEVALTYSDEQGVDSGSLKVTINDVDRTALFTKDAAGATGQVTGFTLPEGENAIAAEVKDTTANLGKTTSSFLVDTIAPAGTLEAPADRVTTSAPAATVHYSDGGSGIDPASVRLTVDEVDQSSLLQATESVATAVLSLQPPLADGTHAVKVAFADRAGNVTTLSKGFVVDTHPPQLALPAPANDAFINDTTPALRATYSDPNGTGVDLKTFAATLQRDAEPARDVTAWFTSVAAGEASGMVADADKLADGTYHLQVRVADVAGNPATADASFEVDTVAPTYRFDTPAPHGYVASVTPAFKFLYDDSLSGVDTERIAVRVDGVDRTSLFAFADGVATGTLPAADALGQGQHTMDVTLYDRAGNVTSSGPQTFVVDTIAPTASIEMPLAGSYVGKAPHAFAVDYADADGSGVDPASVKVTIDGADRTADFTAGAARATANIASQLPDGQHTIAVSVLDWAGNPATASAQFTVDAVDPLVKITAPAAQAWLKGPTLTVTGTVTDASPATVEVNGILTAVTTGAFSATVPAADGAFTVHVTARDAAGNSGTADVTVNVDSLPPVITVAEPAGELVTNKSSVHLAGSATDASAITMTLNGQPLPLASNAFAADMPLANEGTNTFTLVATDAAGNSSTAQVAVTRDTIAPVVAVATPIKSAVIGAVPVSVSGSVTDATVTTVTVDGTAATVTESAWQASIPGLAEGPHTFTVVATDAAGNSTTAEQPIVVDLNAPVVEVTSPANGALTGEPASTITGTATDVSLVSVKASGIAATLTAGTTPDEKSFTIAGVPLVEGDNTVHVIATDAISRTTERTVLITRDSTPPVVSVAGPDQVTRTRAAHLVATATDNLAVKDVAFLLGGTELARLAAGPYVYDFTAPSTAALGDTFSLTIVATDKVGNTASVTKSVRLVAEGALTGQVLSDVTGQPVRGARVRLTGSQPKETVSDDRGRYAFPVNDQNVVLSIDGSINGVQTTTVERVVTIQSGVGTVPVDARLTPLGPAVTIGSSGGTLAGGNVSVAVPAGAVSAPATMHLTPLSAQGLPNLLPLGWASVAAFDVTSDAPLAAPLPFAATIGSLTSANVHLLFYSSASHAWTMVQAGLTPASSILQVSLPEPGTYALAVTDDAGVAVAAAGQLVTGVEMQPIPDTATSSGSVNPPTLPPTGGTATGTLVVKSPSPLPSGTVVQAEITETFSLASGETASEEKRTEDLVLNRSGADLAAAFPIVASRTFTSNDLLDGTVHLDILAGREAVRGKTGGGTQAVTLSGGTVSVTVPAGALPDDVAIAATPTVLSMFLPSAPAAAPFAEVVLDFSGFTLAGSAELSASAASVGSTETVVIGRVERVGGIPKIVIVAAAERSGDRVVSRDLPGFAGIRTGGRYVFYRLSLGWSTISGTVVLGANAGFAVVEVAGLPFVALTTPAGQFSALAPIGTATVSASVPGTSLTGTTSVAVAAGATTSVSFGVAPAATTATVTPENGAIRVPVSVQVEITASAPINQQTGSAVQLRDGNGQQVAVSYVFSGSGRVLAVVPASALQAGESYTVTANGLLDIYGGSVSFAPVTFTTQPDTPPSYDTNRIVFTMPDAGGMVTVSAPAGSLPAGTRVMIVNSGNGAVVSYTVANDGSFTGQLPASISDRLMITISDPKGNVVSFDKSTYVATDGSGRVAIGRAGGRVEGTNGTAIIVPDGALDEGAVFKVEFFGPEKFPERPKEWDGAQFGGGLSITSEQKPALKDEGKLVFPRPVDAPDGAFYYVIRRMTGPNGRVDFETIDHAFINAEGKVETASYPFVGWNDSVDSWDAASSAVGFGLAATVNFFLMWTNDALRPGLPLPGMIVGKAYQLTYKPGQSEPVYEPVDGAMVAAVDQTGAVMWDDPNGGGIFARSQSVNGGPSVDKRGTFALWDWRYTGGPVQVHGMYKGQSVTATAYEASPVDSKTFFSTLFMHYRNVANVNIVFAPDKPVETSAVDVHVMTLGSDNVRRDIDGVTAVGTPLLIGFKFRDDNHGAITAATVNDEQLSFQTDTGMVGTGLKMDYLSGQFFTPASAGSYKVKTTVLNPLGGPSMEVESTFLAVAAGGNNGVPLSGPPDWITTRLVPKNGDIGVATDVLPQIVFTEPVTNVVNGITLTSSDGAVPFTMSGIALDAHGYQYPVADLKAASSDVAVTSVTLQPLGGLAFDRTYALKVTSEVKDLDTDALGAPAPHAFVTKQITFDTIKPQALGSSGDSPFEAPRVAVYDGYAYIAHREPGSPNGTIGVYSLADPAAPAYVTSRAVSGQPMDVIYAEPSTDVNEGHPEILAGSGVKIIIPGPSNFYMFDVTDPKNPQRVGVVSLTESAEDGVVLRLFARKRYAYAITYPKGIQIIDQKIAFDTYKAASESSYLSAQMSKAIVTAGVGFGQDAIVSTIPVRPNGTIAHLFDLAAGDYIVGGVNRTLVYATGMTPLVVVDTTDATVKTTQISPTMNGALNFGRALALARIANRDLVVVAGTGTAKADGTGALTAGPGLMVFDLSDPLVPNLIGSYLLPKDSTDLVVRGTTAFVGTDAGTRVFSLADPTRPKLLGTIDGTGPRMAVLDDGLIVSTSPYTNSPLGGVHTAVYHPIVVVDPAAPIEIAVGASEGTLGNPQNVRTIESRDVKVRVVPNVPVTGGKIVIRNERLTDHLDNLRTDTLTFDAADGTATYTIPNGTTFEDRDLRITATAQSSYGSAEMTSAARRVKLGYAKLTIDSNGNARLDSDDDEAKRKGRVLGFWSAEAQADPSKALADYMTVRITANKKLDAGAVRLRLKRNSSAMAMFYLAEKKQPGVAYLNDEAAATEQLAEIAGTDPGTKGELSSLDVVDLPAMDAGEHEFLFRCTCPGDPNPADYGALRLEKAGASTVYDEANVDIRPMQQWISVRTVRQQGGILDPNASERPLPSPVPVDGWPTQPMQAAHRITYLVHGYNNSEADAIEVFKTWTKRLYWVGVPVLRRQAADWRREDDAPGCAYHCAHVIALSWPGDVGGMPGIRFPSAEFRGMESGVPFAADLRAIKQANPERSIDIIAHSAGNIVTNSALMRLGTGGVVNKYIMNEAAFAAEAFDGGGVDAPLDTGLDVKSTALSFGEYFANLGIVLPEYPPSWHDVRPDPPLADESIVTQRGPWKGYFHHNPQYAEIWNTYNAHDNVLQFVWVMLGLVDKPALSAYEAWLGDLTKSVELNHYSDEEAVFGSPTNVYPGAHLNTILQWRDLAYWFNARTLATGATSVPVFGSRNVEFTHYVPDESIVNSHSYMQNLHFPQVWRAWEQYRDILKPANP